MIDCLLIGFNDYDFERYVSTVELMGKDSGAYQDLRLAFIEYEGRPHRALDILSRFRAEARGGPARLFHNSDFLWPVITYLGTFLARAGFSFDYVNLFHLERERLHEKLTTGDVLTVGVTTTLYVSPDPILEIVSFIRERNRSARIVVGGPYISNQAKILAPSDLEALLDYLGADVYVIGREGELTLTRVVGAIKSGASLAGVPNLAYREGRRFVTTPTEVESNALDENMVDYGLFPVEAFNEFVTTRTAKSCPFSCAFCGFPQRAGQYTYVDVDHVRQELDNIKRIPSVSTITFIDDTFNVPKKRFREILQMMIERDYGFRWNSFYRSDHGDRETIRLMAEAGCEGVFLGVESGSDAMLKRMNKTASRRHYLEAIDAFNAAGISCYASLIVGFPGETDETVAETISLLETARPDFYRAQLWYCDPITPIWRQRDEYGIAGEAFNWSHRTMDWARACELINEMFTSVRGSIWLPQFGFEQWSTFYLQRKGMSMEQVKTFLRAFNAVVQDQMRHPVRTAIEPGLLAALRASCQFDDPAPTIRPQALRAGLLTSDAGR